VVRQLISVGKEPGAVLVLGVKMKSIHFFGKTSTRLLVLVTFLVTLVSCGKQNHQFMKDINVGTSYVDNDVYISVDAQMDFGAMQLPAISLPVKNPKTGEDLGGIEMGVVAGGKNFMKLSFNLSSVTPLQASQAQLPNGAALPLIYTNQVVEIPVGGSKADVRIYISFVEGAYALGVAVPIKSFDGIGGSVGTTSLFPIFNIENIVGSAGLFTSNESGKSGFGVFVDLTNVLDDLLKGELKARTSHQEAGIALKSIRSIRRAAPVGELNYSSIGVSSSKKKEIDKALYRLHRRRARLKLK
jgi:hypothetical protein